MTKEEQAKYEQDNNEFIRKHFQSGKSEEKLEEEITDAEDNIDFEKILNEQQELVDQQ